MEVLTITASSVLPVFAVMAVGFYFGRKNSFETGHFVDFVIYVAMPCLIISSLGKHHIAPGLMLMTGAGCAFVVGTCGLLALAWSRFSGDNGKDLFLCSMFANAANLPFPLALYAFGPEALSYQVIYMAANATLMYTLGVAIVANGPGRGLLHFFKLPLVYASITGVVLSATETTLPDMVMRPIAMLGDTVVPLLLFALGYNMAGSRPSTLSSATPMVIIRVLGGGLAGLAFCLVLDPQVEVKRAILLAAFMPSAVQTFMLSAKFLPSAERSAAAVFLSSVASLVYIPFLVGWLTTLG